MVQELKSEGICGTCNYRSECYSYKNSRKAGRPVFHCEEFDDSGGNVTGKKQKETPFTEVIKNEDGDGDVANPLRAKGLCINCDDIILMFYIYRFPESTPFHAKPVNHAISRSINRKTDPSSCPEINASMKMILSVFAEGRTQPMIFFYRE